MTSDDFGRTLGYLLCSQPAESLFLSPPFTLHELDPLKAQYIMSMQDVYNSMFSTIHSVREYLIPVLKNSKFRETGCVTPEEFVAAGDFLVYKCPTWSWESGESSKHRNYLPADKQFMITRNVPCVRRVKHMEYNDEDAETQVKDDDELESGDSWMYTHSSRVSRTIDEIARNIDDDDVENPIPELERLGLQPAQPAQVVEEEEEKVPEDIPDMDDIPDIDEDDGELVEEEDPAALSSAIGVDSEGKDSDKILQVRTYDVFITYDKYYQTPRLWLFGYDEQRRPLTATQIFEDVSQDYAKKTVTIETHPHLNMSLASIHPCRHAQVMKKIIERMGDTGLGGASREKEDKSGAESSPGSAATAAGEGGIRVDQYLIIFLKFMSSVVPTIDYDHTISA